MIDWKPIQERLGLMVDGVAGPKTYGALFAGMGAKPDVAAGLGAAAARYMPQYGINTALQVAHFLAQAAHETGCFRFFTEIWGPTPAQRGYEGRTDLGNTQPGDGRRYLGRGIFQLTGRANYTAHGLADTPEKAAEPETAMLVACEYWQARRIGAAADADDVRAVTRKINGGFNGLNARTDMLKKAKGLMGVA